jgi:hypothetical protein
MSRLGTAVVAVCALALTGCGGETTTATPTSPAANSSNAPKFGDPVAFTRADNKQPIGTVRFLEAAEIPVDCVIDPQGAQAIGLRLEVENAGELFLSRPDVYDLKVVDRAGFTQQVTSPTLRSRCDADFPRLAPSQPAGKTTGWTFIQVHEAGPATIVYSPLVGATDSTLANLKLVPVAPATAKLSLPSPIPKRGVGEPAPAATTTATAAPNTPAPPAAARPAVGQSCDPTADAWAKDSSGGQLRCAYAGGPSPKWVASAPYVGVQNIGSPCELGAAVAEAPDGQTLVCVGAHGSSTWAPGP